MPNLTTGDDGRTIRRRDAGRTRAALLEAAITLFASKGYTETALSDIATLAATNVALVSRYFGSKSGIFEEALRAVLDVDRLTAAGKARFGDHIVTLLLEDRRGPLPMLLFAAADETARQIAIRLLREEVLKPLAAWLGPPDPDIRAAQISVLCSGFASYASMLPIEIWRHGVDKRTRAWLADALQEIVNR